MRIRWNSVRPLDGAAADATPRAAAATSSASGRVRTRVSGPGSGTGITADCNHVTPAGSTENDATRRRAASSSPSIVTRPVGSASSTSRRPTARSARVVASRRTTASGSSAGPWCGWRLRSRTWTLVRRAVGDLGGGGGDGEAEQDPFATDLVLRPWLAEHGHAPVRHRREHAHEPGGVVGELIDGRGRRGRERPPRHHALLVEVLEAAGEHVGADAGEPGHEVGEAAGPEQQL